MIADRPGQTNAGRFSIQTAFWLALAGVFLVCPSARADGAFADSMRLWLPPDRPNEIALATNFGLVTSEDGGATWTWTCEPSPSDNAFAYQRGPGHRIFAISGPSIVYTDDFGCSWTPGRLGMADARALDVFPDPANPSRVYASVAVGLPRNQEDALLRSTDGGQSFDTILYRPPAGTRIVGLENARASPTTIYLSLREGPGTHPRIARSDDDGKTWNVFDIEPGVGAWDTLIITVDATNPRKVWFRVRGFPDETLALSEDGGQSARVVARIDRGVMSAFGQRQSGGLLLGGVNLSGGLVLSSSDGGATWRPWTKSPHPRDLVERAGRLYVVGDPALDQFSIATSSAYPEDGTGLNTLMNFSDVSRVRACALPRCAAACQFEVERRTFPSSVCAADPVAGPDAAPPTDAMVDGGANSSPGSSGCVCSLGQAPVRGNWGLAGGLLVGVGLALRRRRAP